MGIEVKNRSLKLEFEFFTSWSHLRINIVMNVRDPKIAKKSLTVIVVSGIPLVKREIRAITKAIPVNAMML